MGRSDGKKSIHIHYCRNVDGGKLPSALSRLGTRSDVHLEAVPCSGRTDPRYLLKAFESGARAVCILACPTGNCRSIEGNLRATARVQAVRELLSEAGLPPDSVRIFLPDMSQAGGLDAEIESITSMIAEVAV